MGLTEALRDFDFIKTLSFPTNFEYLLHAEILRSALAMESVVIVHNRMNAGIKSKLKPLKW